MSNKNIFSLILGMFFIVLLDVKGQVYNNVASIMYPGTPAHGMKIKTNIPFLSAVDMVSLDIIGYNFGSKETIRLNLSFYLYHNTENIVYFSEPVISSLGASIPVVKLGNEDGKVVVFIDERVYYPRFYINAFSGYNSSATYYQGWSVVDEPLTASYQVTVDYKNAFKGNLILPNGKWTEEGNVGIGTTTPRERLSVNGKIRAHEIKVETANWPDYVFQPDYDLTPLSEVAKFIKENGHLPEMPKASKVEAEGVSLGEMNKILLKKVEELTLYLIENQEKSTSLEKEVLKLKQLVNKIQKNDKDF